MAQVRSLNNEEVPVSPPTLTLTKNRTTLGRSSACDISIRAENVSRYHATIIRDQNGRYTVEEQGKNGILVNGRSGRTHSLASGDEIIVCKARFIFEQGSPARQGTNPPSEASSLLRKRKRRESNQNSQPPSKKAKGNEGKSTPRPKSPHSLQLATELRAQDIEHLTAALSIQNKTSIGNFNSIRFVIDLTEFLSSLHIPPILKVTSNVQIKDAMSLAAQENRSSALLYFAAIVIAKACDLDKKRVIKKISLSFIEPFFDVHHCYIGIPSILFAATKYQPTKIQFTEILCKKFLTGTANLDPLVKSAQGDLVTNCLLDCARHKASLAPAVEYFVHEDIFTRILHTACDTTPYPVGSAAMTVQLQMLDAVRFLSNIFELQHNHACTARIVHTIHDWVPDLQGLISKAQGPEGSLTACLKALQIIEGLLLLYWKSYFKPVNYHNEQKLLRVVLQMACHTRQQVLLPHCISILRNIFCEGADKSLIQGCYEEIKARKFEWIPHYKTQSIRYFFAELHSIVSTTERLSPHEKEELCFLDLDTFDTDSLLPDALANAEDGTSYCTLL